jgi:hypothetical protein
MGERGPLCSCRTRTEAKKWQLQPQHRWGGVRWRGLEKMGAAQSGYAGCERFIDSSGGNSWSVARPKLSPLCCFQRPCRPDSSQLGAQSGSGTWLDSCPPHVSRSFRKCIPAPQRLLYMPPFEDRHQILVGTTLGSASRGLPPANGAGVHLKQQGSHQCRSRASHFCSFETAMAARSVFALPFKEGKLAAMGPCSPPVPRPRKSGRKLKP